MDKKFDVVIVGTGAAGLYAALNFPESVNILLVSKRELQLSNSSLAQGGVACVLDTVHDSYKLHITDTLIAGKYKNTLSAVEKLVTEGPSDVLKIKDLGVDFDLNEDGTMCKTLEAGHSRNRIVHHKDSTGKAIVDGLIAKVTQLKNVTVCDNALVYSIDKVLNGFYTVCLQQAVSAGFISIQPTPQSQRVTALRLHICLVQELKIFREYSFTRQHLRLIMAESVFL